MTKGKENPCTETSHKEKYYKFQPLPLDSCLNVIPSSSGKNIFHITSILNNYKYYLFSIDSYAMPLYCPSDNRAFAANNVRQMAHRETPPDMVEQEPVSLR